MTVEVSDSNGVKDEDSKIDLSDTEICSSVALDET